jgi:hypothetical protein
MDPDVKRAASRVVELIRQDLALPSARMAELPQSAG